jgi:uncharacterized protein YndB with AHSA1/START domain
MLDPIVKEIEVPCGQRTAFEVFVNDMASWWPLDRFSVSAYSGHPARALRVEPRQGGTITEVAHDGSEHLWGRITRYDPHDYLAMDFHIVPAVYRTGEGDQDFTLVEVRFTPLDDGGTRVRLTQSNWEALGEMAEMVQGGYGKGWTVIFEQRYREACAGRRRDSPATA